MLTQHIQRALVGQPAVYLQSVARQQTVNDGDFDVGSPTLDLLDVLRFVGLRPVADQDGSVGKVRVLGFEALPIRAAVQVAEVDAQVAPVQAPVGREHAEDE